MIFFRKIAGARWVHVWALLLSLFALSGEPARVFQPEKKPVQTEMLAVVRPKDRRAVAVQDMMLLNETPAQTTFFEQDWRPADRLCCVLLQCRIIATRQFSHPLLLPCALARGRCEEAPHVV